MDQHLAFSRKKIFINSLLKLNLFIIALHTNDLFKVWFTTYANLVYTSMVQRKLQSFEIDPNIKDI